MPDTYSIQEFAAKIRERRPDLASVPDALLVGKTLAAAPDLKQFLSQESEPFQSPKYGPTGPTGLQLASEGAAKVLKGNALSGVAGSLQQAINDVRTSGNPQYTAGQKIIETLLGMVTSPMKTENVVAGGIKELLIPGSTKTPPPESPEWEAQQQQAGTMLTMAELPNAASGVAGLAQRGVSGIGRLIQRGVVNPPIVNKWMGIKPGDVSHGANPGQQLIDDNLLGTTKETTLANIKPEIDQLGTTLDAQLAAGDAQGLTYNAKAIVNKRFTDLLNKGVVRTSDAAFRNKVLNIYENINAKLQKQGLNWQSLSPSGVHKLKVEIGDSIDWTGVPAEDAVNRALMKIYGDLNAPIKADIPQLGANLERWGNLRLAQKGLQAGIDKDLVGVGTGSMTGVVARRVAKGAAIAGTGTYVANKMRAVLD